MKKLFVVRKYIMAESVAQALSLERKKPAEEIFVDDDWKKANAEESKEPIGFKTPKKKRA